MTSAAAHVRTSDGRREVLLPGDIIGRTRSAALVLDDPHVSEAHAMLSLRGETLLLLALRRRFHVGGQALDKVELRAGMTLTFAPDVTLTVEEVVLPDAVLGLAGDDLVAQALPGDASLELAPLPRLVAGTSPRAVAQLWLTGDGWRLRVGGSTRAFDIGDVFHVEGRTFTGVRIPLAELGVPHTRADPVTGPLKLVAFFDTVHIHRADGSPVTLSGQMARVVSELVAAGAPLPWHELAGTLWPEVDDRDVVRRRWDVLLVRLRDRLRAAGVRGELVRSSRVRLVELLLLPGDEVEDRT